MTSLEVRNYQEEDDVTTRRTTWTPDVVEAPKAEESKSSNGEILPSKGEKSKPEVMSEKDANEMVKDFLIDPKTPNALANLRVIEEKFKAGSLPKNINDRYKEAKEKAILKLQEDKNFQLALKQAWVKIEGFKENLQEYSEEEASEEVESILGNPATKEQLKNAKNVIIKKYEKLNKTQKDFLEEGLQIFKDSIKKAMKDILPKQ